VSAIAESPPLALKEDLLTGTSTPTTQDADRTVAVGTRAQSSQPGRDWPLLVADAIALSVAITTSHLVIGSIPAGVTALTVPVWLLLAELYGLYDTKASERRATRDLRALVAWSVTGTATHVLLLTVLGVPRPTQISVLTLWPMVAMAAVAVRAGERFVEGRLGLAWRPVGVVASADAVALSAAAALGLASDGLRHADARLLTWGPALFVLILMVSLFAHGAYRLPFQAGTIEDIGRTGRAVSVGALVTLAVLALQGRTPDIVQVVLPPWLIALVTVSVGRAFVGRMHRRQATRGILGQQTLVVTGSVSSSNDVARRLLSDPRHGLRPVGTLSPDTVFDDSELEVPVLGHFVELLEVLERHDVRHVIVDLAGTAPGDLSLDWVMRVCSAHGVEVSLVPAVRRSVNSRLQVSNVAGVPLLRLSSLEAMRAGLAVKHAIDRAIAAVLLVFLSPLFCALALAVRLGSPGAVFYRQRRVGRDSRPFDLVKFRSMRADSAATTFRPGAGAAPGGVEGDDRRTTVGKFLRRTCLDELPQLLNVARGEMSLVGPRPERPEFVDMFRVTHSDYDDRLRVKAGMTGLAQIRGLRGQTSMSERLLFDNSYIENWSLWLDLKVLLLTLPAVLRTRAE
jgi:exopolysaccharide biosynthesis polyprenyl glycosylphosphotransferase